MNRNIKIGETYKSNNYGDFIVLNKNDGGKYTIKFINTNGLNIASGEAIYHGRVKDKYAPNVSGIGYVGSFDGKISDDSVIIFYRPWSDMMHRCYDKNDKDYKMYGGIGIQVDERWHDFGNFFNDAKILPGYANKLKNPSMYCLDKDYLQQNIPKNKRIYSKDTCVWLSKYDNILIMNREKHNSEYYGVIKHNNKYYSRYSNTIIGKFSNPIAAANAYNYYYNLHFSNDPLRTIFILNNVPYMPPNEFIKYNTNPKEMCKIIDK